MKPEIRDMWADALESDEYTQGTHRLTTVLDDGTEQDCCLGVLCKLAVKAGVIPPPVPHTDDDGVKGLAYGAGGVTGLLPPEVAAWAGLEGNSPSLTVEDDIHSADYLNDSAGLTFGEIAELVREQF